MSHRGAFAALIVVSVFAFAPLFGNDFVNWDDPTVILDNQELSGSHVVAWAFSTTLIGHYQPLAWLAWSAAKNLFGLNAAAFHALSLGVHILNALLVYVIALRLAAAGGSEPPVGRTAALVTALVFSVHPVRVEAVAWASAFPYVLALTGLLVSFLAYDEYCTRSGRSGSVRWLTAAVVAYALSTLVRAVAIGFPFVLVAADVYPLRRRVNLRLILEKVPFLVVAVAAAAVESNARQMATLQDIGLGPRLTMAALAPFVYLGRTLVPIRLSPLDPLPIAPTLDVLRLGLGLAGLAAVAIVCWRSWRQWPAIAVTSTAFIFLLAPVVGLTPSGLQATADRYVYAPGVIVSLLVGAAVARALVRVTTASAGIHVAYGPSVLTVVVIGTLAVLTWQQARWWHDSITLWTRAADLDPRNDVATYNLAIALAGAGRDDEAIQRYEQTLRIVPDHTLARDSLNALRARQAEREGDRLADAGRLAEAAQAYSRGLVLDSTRLHARAARGIVLTRLGRAQDAVADLRTAYDSNVRDAAVLNAFAFALTETGRVAEAADVLKSGVRRYPDDINLAHNLARLLATTPDTHVRDGPLALELAMSVRARTGSDDPRVLDTLAAAYAATGRADLARETAEQAVQRARQNGDTELAAEIAAHARQYEKR
jgi:tetratricopeptide (TPR) repeat protein